MRSAMVVLCSVLVASCSGGGGSTSAVPGASSSAPLTAGECTRLVHRAYANLFFSRDSVPDSPMESELLASCESGKGVFKRGYYDCVFAAKYSDPLDCAAAARGIDRRQTNPLLAARHVGENASFEQSVRAMDVIYHGQDPRTTMDSIDVDRYLDERDNVDRSLGVTPPDDRAKPRSKSASQLVANGQTYWVVREDFTELQLAKIRWQDAASSKTVWCAQFGDTRRLALGQGLCGAMLAKYFDVKLQDAPAGASAPVDRGP